MRRSSYTRTLTASVVAAALVGTGVTGAVANEDSTEATANLIADVAPDQGEIVPGAQRDGQITSQVDQVEATVPLDPTRPIVLDDVSGEAPPLEVSLPAEVAVADGRVSTDGTIIYHGTDNGADAAVQTLTDGSVRIQTITPNADGPHSFTYRFGEGITLVEGEDGTIELVQQIADQTEAVVGTVDQPWAVDANGRSLNTEYAIEGSVLVQTIDTDAATAYPIVADPQIRPGNGMYVRFSKSETRTIANNGIWLTASTGLCAVIPIIGVAGACAFVDAVFKDSLRNTFAKARDANQCVELRYTWFITTWRLNSWKGISC